MLTVHASEAFILYNKLTTSVSSNQKVLEKSKIGHFYLTIPVPQEDRMDLFTNPEHPSFQIPSWTKMLHQVGPYMGSIRLVFAHFVLAMRHIFFIADGNSEISWLVPRTGECQTTKRAICMRMRQYGLKKC